MFKWIKKLKKFGHLYLNLRVARLTLSGGKNWFVLRVNAPSTESWWSASVHVDLRSPMMSLSVLARGHLHGLEVSPTVFWAY